MRRNSQRAILGALLVGVAACNADRLNVPSYNSPTVEDVAKDINGIQLLATGILRGERDNYAGQMRQVGIFGREAYNYFTTDARNITGPLVGIPGPRRIDPTGFANGFWAGRYQNMKNSVALLQAAEASPALSAPQKLAVAGFAKTFRALNLYYVIATRDTLGAPVDIVENPTSGETAPFVSRDSVYKFISAMLDEANANLLGGGTAFPFTLTSGFAGFNTPATFAKFNRAIAARVLVARGTLGCGNACYSAALTAIGASFATPIGGATSLADLNIGVYHVYSTTSGDATNANSFVVNNFVYAHKSVVTDAQTKPDGTLDNRVLRKVVKLETPVTAPQGLSVPAEYRFSIYPENNSPAPIIRNEELLLLRAEANLALGNTAATLQDVNNVRTVSGGLAPLAALPPVPLDAIIYEKRMSMLLEGLRWEDMRRWGRLNQLPIDLPTHFIAKVMPIPQAECDARPVKPRGCEGNL